MLYPRSKESALDPELFKDPGAEYRCTPFWAWNCDLEEGLLRREIGYMKQMGMGGFHMHTRSGMSVPYLSDAFMQKIRVCVEEAKKQHMLAWLYDEDKWPSGFAGGYVTKNKENRQRFLLLSPNEPESGGGRLLAKYEVTLDGEGYLASYRRLWEHEPAEGPVWYALEKRTEAGPWFHFNGYTDTMNPSAIRDFIHITHDRYLAVLGDDLGSICPAIFTDEPQMPRKTTLSHARDRQDVLLPWTGDLEETYRAAFGESLLDRLPEIVWEQKDGISPVRYRFFDHTTERFVSAFCDQIGAWCRSHGILMTGHMMDEATLDSQTRAVGEAMRAYRAFTLPGVDQLCDGHEFTTLKQAASAAHQQGCPGVASEMYGVTNWDFDFKGHKLQGDWQAALGVTVRVPHLYWCSMHGESKRDYPASIGHQSAWWREYPFIEDHFARVNTVMTRGKPLIRIGVIHPIESNWIAFGPDDQTAGKRGEMYRRFEQITRWLLFDTLDFDFICESTLPSLFRPGDTFNVGEMAYDAVIVPMCDTLRRTTLNALNAFRERGGQVVFLGAAPRYVDALPSGDAQAFSLRCENLPWDMDRLSESLRPLRQVRILTQRGRPAENLLCALREDGGCRSVFLCHVMPAAKGAPDKPEDYRVELRGLWNVSVCDTGTGEIAPLQAEYGENMTCLSWHCFAQDSLLLRLSPADGELAKSAVRASGLNGSYGIRMAEEFSLAREPKTERMLPPPDEIILGEDNVLVLDTAQWRADSGPWQEKEEMLRIGVAAKELLGISTAAVSGAQPWALPPEKPEHTLFLRIAFRSEIALPSARLALEDADISQVRFNGEALDRRQDGYFTDESIRCFRVGPVRPGVNTVEIVKPIAASICTENLFLLGDFGVRVTGAETALIPAPRTLAFGDWTQQGLPFYSGPLTYRWHIRGGERLRLRLGLFSAPCVTAELDGKRAAHLSLSPSETDLGRLPPGDHILDITVYPSRINSFGAFHLNDASVLWFGPQAWRTAGMRWTRTYRLTPSGLLSEPHLFEAEK
ncbi:MAG: hypothetical protein IKQ41_02595 [Clostridia bacterium]|nr:hypothetical protein [Clostridia bacterium]